MAENKEPPIEVAASFLPESELSQRKSAVCLRSLRWLNPSSHTYLGMPKVDDLLTPDLLPKSENRNGETWVQLTIKNKTQFDLLLESAEITGTFSFSPGSIAPFAQSSFAHHIIPGNHWPGGRCKFKILPGKNAALDIIIVRDAYNQYCLR